MIKRSTAANRLSVATGGWRSRGAVGPWRGLHTVLVAGVVLWGLPKRRERQTLMWGLPCRVLLVVVRHQV